MAVFAVPDHHQVAVVQENHPVGVGQEGGHVRGQEKLARFAQAQHQGRVLARPDDGVRLAAVQDDQGIGAPDAPQGPAHRRFQVRRPGGSSSAMSTGHDLGVGLGGEVVPGLR